MHENSKFVNVRKQTVNIKGGDDQTSPKKLEQLNLPQFSHGRSSVESDVRP